MTVWKPEPHLILDTERRGERGGDEVLSACGFHGRVLLLVDWFGHFTFSMLLSL